MNQLLLVNAHVLTMDPQFTRYNSGAVLIEGTKIKYVGTQDDIQKQYPGIPLIDCQGKVLMPGLINAHTHVPMTLLRGLADDLRLDVWLLGYMMPVEREFVSPDFVRLGTLLACAEMIRSGVTCFADMYYFEQDIAKASVEAGMRSVCGQTVLKYPTPDASSYEESLALAEDFIKKWKDDPLVTPAIAPHAPYTCTPEILKASAALAAQYDIPLHIHLSETASEVENMRNEQGMPVIPYVKKQELFDAKVIAAHCVHIDEGEMRTLLHGRAGVAHNPSSNLKLASGFAPVKKMLEIGLNVGIGTDGPASNNDLDMFEEIRLAAFIAKAASNDPVALPARTTLMMATRMGAQALHIGNQTGSIEPGKQADLILVDLNKLHNSPKFERDPNAAYAQIVYSAHSADVTDVMVNGKWLMQERCLTTLNEKELLYASQQYARRIDIFLTAREKSVLSKLIAIGGAMEQESYEVQVKVRIAEPEPVFAALLNSQLQIIRSRHYKQYDTYFLFKDTEEGSVRFREDDFIGENGQVNNVRLRLTLIGPTREEQLPEEVFLSRSRYYAPATNTLRFYREYFQPDSEIEIQKERWRYLINYQNTEMYINIDQVNQPNLGHFVEIKCRTWSKRDAIRKSKLAIQLLTLLNAAHGERITSDYLEIVKDHLQ